MLSSLQKYQAFYVFLVLNHNSVASFLIRGKIPILRIHCKNKVISQAILCNWLYALDAFREKNILPHRWYQFYKNIFFLFTIHISHARSYVRGYRVFFKHFLSLIQYLVANSNGRIASTHNFILSIRCSSICIYLYYLMIIRWAYWKKKTE